MKKIIFGIIIGVLISGGIVYGINLYSANDILYTTGNGEETNVNNALNDLYDKQQNSVKKSLVFTTSPVDMKQYTDRWAELTTADFKGGWSGGNAWSQTDSGAASGQNAWAYAPSFTLSYDKNTGVLTFSTSKTGEKRWSSGSTLFNRMELTGGFAVWLGTINGK